MTTSHLPPIEVAVLWSAGYDVLLVDPSTLRDMTPREVARTEADIYSPCLGDWEWLRCSFTSIFPDGKVVKILQRLQRGD